MDLRKSTALTLPRTESPLPMLKTEDDLTVVEEAWTSGNVEKSLARCEREPCQKLWDTNSGQPILRVLRKKTKEDHVIQIVD